MDLVYLALAAALWFMVHGLAKGCARMLRPRQ